MVFPFLLSTKEQSVSTVSFLVALFCEANNADSPKQLLNKSYAFILISP